MYSLFLICIMFQTVLSEMTVSFSEKLFGGFKTKGNTTTIKPVVEGEQICYFKVIGIHGSDNLAADEIYKIDSAKIVSDNKRLVEIRLTPLSNANPVCAYLWHRKSDGPKLMDLLNLCWRKKQIVTNCAYIESYDRLRKGFNLFMDRFSKYKSSGEAAKLTLLDNLNVVMPKYEGDKLFRKHFSLEDNAKIVNIETPRMWGKSIHFRVKFQYKTKKNRICRHLFSEQQRNTL